MYYYNTMLSQIVQGPQIWMIGVLIEYIHRRRYATDTDIAQRSLIEGKQYTGYATCIVSLAVLLFNPNWLCDILFIFGLIAFYSVWVTSSTNLIEMIHVQMLHLGLEYLYPQHIVPRSIVSILQNDSKRKLCKRSTWSMWMCILV